MPQKTNLLFVYGTLRKGGVNQALLRASRFLGKGKTAQPFALYVGEYPYVCRQETRCPITGEVYAVDDVTLAMLDAFEEHPEVYRREQTEIVLDKGQGLLCWLYFFPHPRGRLIASGDFIQSCSTR